MKCLMADGQLTLVNFEALIYDTVESKCGLPVCKAAFWNAEENYDEQYKALHSCH